MSIIDVTIHRFHRSTQMKGDGEDTAAAIRVSQPFIRLPGRLNYQHADQHDWTGIEAMPQRPPRTEPLPPSKATINHQQSAINQFPPTINSLGRRSLGEGDCPPKLAERRRDQLAEKHHRLERQKCFSKSSLHRFSPSSVSTTDFALPTGFKIIPFFVKSLHGIPIMPLPGAPVSVERKIEKRQHHLIDFILIVRHALSLSSDLRDSILHGNKRTEQGVSPNRQPFGSL
jgi:hypothetical protein